AVLQCSLADLAPGASASFRVIVRPLRPGRLTDGVAASDDEADPNFTNDFAKTVATVRTRATAARVRIVPVQASARPGQVVGFVVTIGVIKRIPGGMPSVCVTVPPVLRVVRAPGAVAARGRLCWDADALVSGAPRSFGFSARVPASHLRSPPPVHARLPGANFAASGAAPTVAVLRRRVTACPSSLRAGPLAGIAC